MALTLIPQVPDYLYKRDERSVRNNINLLSIQYVRDSLAIYIISSGNTTVAISGS